jgi:hypothetical protein
MGWMSLARSIFSFGSLCFLVIACSTQTSGPGTDSGTAADAGGGGDSGLGGDAGLPPGPPALACAWPSSALVGSDPIIVALYGAGIAPGATASWNGMPRPATVVDAGLALVTLSAQDLAAAAVGSLSISNPPPGGAPDASLPFAVTQPAARRRIPADGLYTQIERRGWPSEYWSGELLQQWSIFDPVTNDTPAQEAQLQLQAMQQMGVNAVTLELRAADGGGGAFVPPACPMPYVLGLQYPRPQPVELTQLGSFLDLSASMGIKVWLRLPNTHMEETPPTNNATWLASVLGAIQGHPALDAVLFDGSPNIVNGQCGLPAEPALWEGASSTTGRYVQWAIGYALDAGFPARQLSAEEIVGGYQLLHSPNLQDPVLVMREIFDALQVPANQRTYAVSMYEQPRCQSAGGLPCVDERPDLWAQETLDGVWAVIGHCSGARVIATEMGTLPPLDGGWRSEWSVENLGALFERSGVEGGGYWLWTNFQNSDDANPTLASPVKYRGVPFVYSPVQREIADLGGQHPSRIPNGSFEQGDGGVDAWSLGGLDGGTGVRYRLAAEPGQPEVVTRGNWVLQLSSGSDPNGTAWADSARLPALPDAGYVVTGLLRFGFSGDPDAGAPGNLRPQVRVSVLYFATDGGSAARPRDDFRFFQENAANDFVTYPLSFTTPVDAAQVQFELAVERHGLPTPLVADVDDLR